MDAAIAEVVGELGIIPSAAAKEIMKKATGDYVKVSRVAELARGKGLDIAAELSVLAEVCENGGGEFIRMGSAGIDNYETAWGLLIKDALAVTLRDLDKLIGILADLTQSIAIPYALGVPSGNTKDRLLLATRPRCGQWNYIIANVF